MDYYDLKGVVCSYLQSLKLDAHGVEVVFEAAEDTVPFLHPKSATSVYLKNNSGTVLCGFLGEVHPALMERLNMSEKAFVFEIELGVLTALVNKVAKATLLPKFPSVKETLRSW